MALEVTPEEGGVREIQRIGNLLYGEVAIVQFGFGIEDDGTGNDVGGHFRTYFATDGAQVFGRDAEFVGIEGNAPLVGIVLYQQGEELFEDDVGATRLLVSHLGYLTTIECAQGVE